MFLALRKMSNIGAARKLIAGAVLVPLLASQFGGTAFAQVRRLNGVYVANDGSQLLVEAVPVNRGERLTLIFLDVEISVDRTDVTKPFVYRHNKCELIIFPHPVDKKPAISIEAFGICNGGDQVFEGLNIAYFRR